jgi:phosphatidylcholine synthase
MALTAWLVHAYTASGIVLAFLAARAVIDFDYRTAFFWLWVQVFVDATDGLLARRLRVRERIPWFDGSKLDDITDYLTYVFVPALFVWRGALVPTAWALPVAAAILLSSAYGFNRADAKTSDHFFTGFPSYWNVVTFYLLVAGERRDPRRVCGAGLRAHSLFVPVPNAGVAPCHERLRRNLGGDDAAHAVAVSGGIAAALLGVVGVPRVLFPALVCPSFQADPLG